MTWRDEYRQARFRGVPFKISESEAAAGGQRAVIFEYPGRDTPYAQTLGRRAREFTVSGFLVGDNYRAERDALLAATERPGAGELVHPFYGAKTVVCLGARVRETTAEGGYCSIELIFSEAGGDKAPTRTENPVAVVDQAGDELAAIAQEQFASDFSLKNMPQFVVDSAAGMVSDLVSVMQGLASPISTTVQVYAKYAKDLAELGADAVAAVQKPVELPSKIAFAVASISATYGRTGAAFDRLVDLFDQVSFDTGLEDTTATRRQQRENHLAFAAVTKTAVLREAAATAARLQYQTQADAIRARDTLTERIDDLMESADDYRLYSALQKLREKVTRALPPPAHEIPRLQQVTLPAPLPSLVMAHDLYGNTSNADDIVARNNVSNPCFVPGDISLQVLAYE